MGHMDNPPVNGNAAHGERGERDDGMHQDDDLLEALRHMPRTLGPPSAVEEATVARLRARGLLTTPARASWWRPVAVAASLALTFGAGYFSRTPTARPAATHLVVLLGDEVGDSVHAVRAAEYAAWARGTGPLVRVVGGSALRSLSGAIPAAADGLVVGYFLIASPDDETARRVAEQCPHRKYGGTVIVRALRSSTATKRST